MNKISYSLLSPELFMDTRGQLFEKVGSEYRRIWNKYVAAEERYVKNELTKKGVRTHE